MALLERITVDSNVVHGRPAVRGTRVRVADVLSLLAAGATELEILEDYPYLEPEDIKACLEYAAAQAGHVGNTTRRGLLEWFEPLLDQVTTMVEAGERLIELR